MNPIDVIVGQYSRTIAELSARLAQAALELAQAQERIAELEKPKEPKLASAPSEPAAS